MIHQYLLLLPICLSGNIGQASEFIVLMHYDVRILSNGLNGGDWKGCSDSGFY